MGDTVTVQTHQARPPAVLSLVCKFAGCNTELHQHVIKCHGISYGEAARMLQCPCAQLTGAGLC